MMKKNKLSKNQKNLRTRIIEISYKNKLSHIGSCFNAVDLIDGVYKVKSKNDIFILSAGHSAVAWYTVLEKYNKNKNYDTITCIHPDRSTNSDVLVSTGSLGQGLPIAVGIALADKNKRVYCMISDGEASEGSIWEALRIIADNNIYNITVLATVNGYGAYDKINANALKRRFEGFGLTVIEIDGHDEKEIEKALKNKLNSPVLIFANTTSEQLPFLVGQNAHYYVMNDDLSTARENLS